MMQRWELYRLFCDAEAKYGMADVRFLDRMAVRINACIGSMRLVELVMDYSVVHASAISSSSFFFFEKISIDILLNSIGVQLSAKLLDWMALRPENRKNTKLVHPS